MLFSFADIESTMFSNDFSFERIEKMDFELGCVITYDENRKEVSRFYSYDLNEYCEYLQNLERVYFHNLSFDFKFLKEKLLSQNDHFQIIDLANSTLLVNFYKKKVKKTHKTLELRDSLALLKSSIKNLGIAINLPKLIVKDNKFKDVDYCFRDCEVIAFSIFNLIDFCMNFFNYDLELRKMPLTISSLAKKLFTNIYDNTFYFFDYKINDKMRKYYYGGRVEIFDFNLLKDACYYDVVSLYPSICIEYKLPNGYCYFYEGNFTSKHIEKFRYKLVGFECFIVENQYIPLYPSRTKGKDAKTVYINGLKKVFMSIYEYDYLKSKGYLENKIVIKKITAIITCKNMDTFDDYFIPIFTEKSNTKIPSNRYFCKILMNGLTGKFGQRNKVLEKTYFNTQNIDTSKAFHFDIDLDCSYEVKEKTQRFLTNNLVVIIMITNLARFTLWKNLVNLVKKGISVYYCDTDSIVANNKASKFLNFGNKLGQWNIEHKAKLFQAIDCKEYFFIKDTDELIVKFKGLRTNDFSIKDIENHYKKGTITRMIPKFNYCILRNIDSESVVFLRKQKRQYYSKRLITNDLKTIPLHIRNLDMKQIESFNAKIIKDKVIKSNKFNQFRI